MVARYWALILSGKRRLPADFVERACADEQMEEGMLRLSAHRIHSLLVYGEFMESMAQHIGCSPNLLYYFVTDPLMWLRMFTGPMVGAQFRLTGPGACPELASQVIAQAPIPTPIPFRIAQGLAGVASWIGGALLGFNPPSW